MHQQPTGILLILIRMHPNSIVELMVSVLIYIVNGNNNPLVICIYVIIRIVPKNKLVSTLFPWLSALAVTYQHILSVAILRGVTFCFLGP